MLLKKIFFITTICLFSACQINTPDPDARFLPFFDIADFIDKEMIQLSNLKSIKKTVYINDKTEERILDSFDIKKDLEIFKKSNINKVVWIDKYKVDSLFDKSGDLAKLQYQALDEKLKTRIMIIAFNGKKVHAILIKNKSSNQVSSLEQDLEYYPQKGYYSIKSRQKVSLNDEQVTTAKVRFLDF